VELFKQKNLLFVGDFLIFGYAVDDMSSERVCHFCLVARYGLTFAVGAALGMVWAVRFG